MPDIIAILRVALADRYTILQELGAGGMATVYLAEDLRHHRHVAVKVLKPEIAATLGGERFSQEIDVAARLQHPHILPLLDSGEAGGFFYYVMPYVDGESLRTRLTKQGELPVPEAIRILIQVTDALAHAHTQRLVHRDIKPDNILISGRHALVMDFGVAKAVSEATGRQQLTTAGVALGTPAYMAPEQAVGDKNLDHRVDIYAIGVLGYELLTGRAPFSGLTPQETLAAHVTRTPEPLERERPGLSPAVAAVIMKCLAKRAADRWQTAEELLAQLEAVATPSGGITPTSTPLLPSQRPRPTTWLAVAGVAAAIVFAGILIIRPRAPVLLQLGRRTQATLDPGLDIDPALSPDGKLVAYATNAVGDMKLMVRQVGGGSPVRVAPDLAGAQRLPFWTPDGRAVLFLSARGIELIPALGGASRVLVHATGSGLFPGPVSPDGRTFAYVRGDSLVTEPLGGGADRLVAVARDPHSPAWSPDGNWLAFVSGNSDYIDTHHFGNIAQSAVWVAPAAGGQPHALTDDRSLNVSPVWLPGGRALLFVSNRDGGRDVYEVGVSGSGTPIGAPARLTTGINAHAISLSADGAALAYSVFTERSNVWSMPIPPAQSGPVSVAQAQPVTAGNQTIESFDVSRDNAWLVYDSNRGGYQEIYRARLAGGEPEQLTSDSTDHFWPMFSPDGRRLAFHAFRGGHRQAFVIPAEGGAPVQVTQGETDMRTPDWVGERALVVAQDWGVAYRLHVVTENSDGSWSRPTLLAPTGWDTSSTLSGSAEVSPDGRLIGCDCGGVALFPLAGGPLRVLAPIQRPAQIEGIDWSSDERLLYYLYSDSTALSIRSIPVAGGTPRVLVRLDDPTRPWHRYGFRARGGRFYFTFGDLQSNIWVADMK
ncbi:MAG TPA: protein kinase [Gemmatimonadales bacterium]|nr:protein kinase [Gemmatimonadales bacterium]